MLLTSKMKNIFDLSVRVTTPLFGLQFPLHSFFFVKRMVPPTIVENTSALVEFRLFRMTSVAAEALQ